MDNHNVTIDEKGIIHIIPPEHLKHSELLESESRSFIHKVNNFNDGVNVIVDSLSKMRDSIEKEKQIAIGQRLLAENERGQRNLKVKELQSLIAEREAELSLLQTEFRSLVLVEQQQKDIINNLTNRDLSGII